MKKLVVICLLFLTANVFSQTSDSVLSMLKMDTSYAYFQYDNPALAESLKKQLSCSDTSKFVIYHYGGSHIQAESPPTVARRFLQEKYGNAGRGMMFSYGAADTYSSINYTSTKTGTWIFAKSFIGNPKVPLGVCGMSVETAMPGATLGFKFKEALPKAPVFLRVLTDADTTNFGFELMVNDRTYKRADFRYIGSGMFEVALDTVISTLNVKTVAENPGQKRFRFYGIDIESQFERGVVYHSLGVGAAAFRSVLQLEKVAEHSKVLKPDMVILDFGTNDILYTNSIDDNLGKQVEKAIRQFREINPDILVVLTSTQDLFKKGKYITAGVSFVTFMDSLAKKNDCFFWNWYDLAGGYGTITTWKELKYAKSDGIHLTNAGYEVKGEYIYRSMENTLKYYDQHPSDSLLIAQKKVDFTVPPVPDGNSTATTSPKPKPVATRKVYTVRSGDTLGGIAAKNRTTVAKIKKANGLRSDRISIGQKLKIPA